jgi:DNA-binding NarL/FixJ family response regulator
MSLDYSTRPIRVGVLTDEPLRIEGLEDIFEDRPSGGYAPLLPVRGTLEEFLAEPRLTIMVVDLSALSRGVRTVEDICRRRPEMQLVVIGSEENDKLIMDLIQAGARAYLDLKASPRIVRQAVEVVITGSIWAPRRVLSKLIDRLRRGSDSSLTNGPPRFTDREKQILDLIRLARSNREIAGQLGIEEGTVQAHVGKLMRKTGTDNRIDLIMRSSNAAQLQAGGIPDRRKGDRRLRDRLQAEAFAPWLIDPK